MKRISGNFFKNSSHRVLRYVIKVGDLEEAVHVFRDLLGMAVFNHEEFEDGSPDGGEVHYEGKWSRTILGYGSPENDTTCIQLTFNHGIEKYDRGNHLQAIVIELSNTNLVEEAGCRKELCRGRETYFVDCNGYNIEVVKSNDKKSRIRRIIFNCRHPLSLSGPTIRFWTQCLKFEVAVCSSDIASGFDMRGCFRRCCCCCVKTDKVKALQKDERPYVELQYGHSTDFYLRLQNPPNNVGYDIGTGRERLLLTCSRGNLSTISILVKTVGRIHGGMESKKSFQLVPGRTDLMGVVAQDPNGLEVCYYSDDEVRLMSEIQDGADDILKRCITAYKQRMEQKRSRGR